MEFRANVIGIEYDPNRTANIALICYEDGEKAYILAPEGLKVGMKVMNGPEAEVRVGNCLPLSEIPVGTQIHNIELLSGQEADRWYVPPETARSSWRKKESTQPFVFLPER